MSRITPKEALLVTNASYDALGDSAVALSVDPRLSPAERAVLTRVHQLAVDRRLRDEHPVLGRFIASLEGSGKPLSTKEDWATLKTLLGPTLSEAEKDGIDRLAKNELIAPAIRDQYFEPFREVARKERVSMIKSASITKTATSVSSMVAGFGAAIGANLLLPGAGLLLLVAMPFAQRKLDTTLAANKDDKIGSYGVDRLAGAEVDHEMRLILSSLATFRGGLDGSTAASLIDTAQSHVAMVRNLQKSREAVAAETTPEEQVLASAADKYASKLEALLKDGKKTSDVEALRTEIYKARAEALAPEVVRAAIVSTIADGATSLWPEIELAFADAQLQAFEAVRDALKPGGLSTKEQRESIAEDSAVFLQMIKTIEQADPGIVNKDLKAFFLTAYTDLPGLLTSDVAKKLSGAGKLDEVKKDVDRARADVLSKQKPITWEQAEEIGQQVANKVFTEVLPRYVQLAEAPKLKSLNATKLPSGGHRVEGELKQGMFGSEGKFSIDIAPDGTPDARSLKIDIGERAKESAMNAAEEYAQIFSTNFVTLGAQKNVRTKSEDPYELAGFLGDGAQRWRITISPEGIPDRRSFSIS